MEVLRTISLYVEGKDMPFAVIGGHAVNAYWISRQTGDLDLIVRGSDKEAWSALMKKMNYKSGQHDDRFARYRPDATPAWPIDLMFVDDETFRKILSDSVEMEFGPARARAVSSRHLNHIRELQALRTFTPEPVDYSLAEMIQMCEQMLPYWNALRYSKPEPPFVGEAFVLRDDPPPAKTTTGA